MARRTFNDMHKPDTIRRVFFLARYVLQLVHANVFKQLS